MSQRYYDTLGVSKDSTILEIKDAYERLCKEYEPSNHQFDPEYVRRYDEVQEAFDWLKNNHTWSINLDEGEVEQSVPSESIEKQEKLIKYSRVFISSIVLSCLILLYVFQTILFNTGNKSAANGSIGPTQESVKRTSVSGIEELKKYDEYGIPIRVSTERFAEIIKRSYPEYKASNDADAVSKFLKKHPEYDKWLNPSEFKFDFSDIVESDENNRRNPTDGLGESNPFLQMDGLGDAFIPPADGIVMIDKSPNTTTSLSHGSNPYGYCYTSSKSCSSRCSEIKVSASSRVGTIIIIKQKEEVVRCAYIDKGRTFTFKLPNGTYTPYFYSGTGWSNKKYMKTTTQCGRLYGGFTAGESVGKDTPQTLNNQILSYDLNTQYDGNFQTKSSDVSEAF